MLTDVKYEGVDNFSDLIGTLVTCPNSTLASIRALELQNRTNCQFILKSLNYCNQNTHQEVEGTLTLASREKREAEGECTSKCCSRPMKVNIRFFDKRVLPGVEKLKPFSSAGSSRVSPSSSSRRSLTLPTAGVAALQDITHSMTTHSSR